MGLWGDTFGDPAWRERQLRRYTPGTFADDYVVGLDRIAGGRVGDPSASVPGTYNPTWGDAARTTLGTFTPNVVYEPPPKSGPGNIYEKGTQRGDVDPTGVLEFGGKTALIIAAIVAALAVSR